MNMLKGDFELDPPRVEADNFVLDAFMQLGAEPHPEEDDRYIVPASTIMEMARRIRHSVAALPVSNLVRKELVAELTAHRQEY